MPLTKRTIDPVNLSKGQVGQGVSNELECVTNSTLANIIRQLGSLSKHAEDIFTELFTEANSFFERANHLQTRVEALKVKVTRLDSTVEEVSLKEIDMRKPFKSSVIKDSQVISPRTMPVAMLETYHRCDAPPPLSKLNKYREDGKDSMKFYTDTTYFFELWCREIQKDTEQQKKEIRRRRRQRPKQPHREDQHKIREVKTRKEEYEKMKYGKEFVPETPKSAEDVVVEDKTPSRPNSLELGHMQIPADPQHQRTEQQQSHEAQIPQGYGNLTYPNGHAVGAYNGQNVVSGHQQHLSQYSSPAMPYSHNHNMAAMMAMGEPGSPRHFVNSPQYAQSPVRSTPSSRIQSTVNSPSSRPSHPPPAPPAGSTRSSPNKSLHASRESLPPPPPPPMSAEVSSLPEDRLSNTPRDSPVRQNVIHHQHTPSPTGSKTPDSMDLPPPPPPPPAHPGSPESMNSMSPPPPAPPPLSGAPLPPPPPPPPPPQLFSHVEGTASTVSHQALPPDVASISSVSSAQTSTSASTARSDEKDKEADSKDEERTDLLQAIRKGIQLRKVEKKEEQKKTPQGGLDVQSIMEAAFELRRKALEADDSDSHDSDSDQEWGSDDM